MVTKRVPHGELRGTPRTPSSPRVTGRRRESPLPAFRVFPFPPNDLRQAFDFGTDLRFDGEFSLTVRDPAGSRKVSEISGQNSQTLWLTTPTELTGRSVSGGVRDGF